MSVRSASLWMSIWIGLSAPKNSIAAPECFKVPTEGFRNFSGTSEHRNRDTAIANAKANAFNEMKRSVCTGTSISRCEQAKRHAGLLAEWYDNSSKLGCALYQINGRHLDSLANDLSAFSGQVAEMTEQFTRGNKNVWLVGPSWAASACSGGVEGKSIGIVVNQVFQDRGFTIKPDAQQVELSLSPLGPSLMLSAVSFQNGSLITSSVNFPKDLFRVDESSGKCGLQTLQAGGVNLSLDPLYRQRVHLEVSLKHGTVCEGERFIPTLKIRQPSDVILVSIDLSGQAYVVWPIDGVTSVKADMSLGEWVATYTGDGDDQLLVASFSSGASVPIPASAPCKIAPADISRVLGTADSLGSTAYRVYAGGSNGCGYSVDAKSLAGQANDYMKNLKQCRF